jgi:MoaA/NifB/PqqE/SkfB family radical SAM enzyme
MPLLCNYYVTLRCNARCTFCNIHSNQGGVPRTEPTLDQVERNLRDAKRLGVKILDLTGGEPLLYSKLPEALSIAKKIGFFVSVTTNGLLYPKLADALAGKIDSLLLSIESPQPSVHDRIRGVPSFAKVLEAIQVARKHNPIVYLSHVVTDEAMSGLDDMIRFAQHQHSILYLNPCFSYFGNPGLSPANALKLMTYFQHPGVIIDRAQLRLIADGGNQPSDPVCRAASSTVVISPDNKLVLPCFHFQTDAVPLDGGLMEAWRSSRRQSAQALQGRHGFCKGCTIYCYMRGSLYRKYPLDTVRMTYHYLRERWRHRLPQKPVAEGAAAPGYLGTSASPGAAQPETPSPWR